MFADKKQDGRCSQRSRRLSLESLESRTLLAADFTAVIPQSDVTYVEGAPPLSLGTGAFVSLPVSRPCDDRLESPRLHLAYADGNAHPSDLLTIQDRARLDHTFRGAGPHVVDLRRGGRGAAGGLATTDELEQVLESLRFSIPGHEIGTNSREITVRLTGMVQFKDGLVCQSRPVESNESSIIVRPVDENDPPAVRLSRQTVLHDSADTGTSLDPFAVVTDPDSPDFAGGRLVVSVAGNASAGDQVHVNRLTSDVGGAVFVEGKLVGTASEHGGSSLTIDLAAGANTELLTQLVREIEFATTSTFDAPRRVELLLEDGDGGVSRRESITVLVTSQSFAGYQGFEQVFTDVIPPEFVSVGDFRNQGRDEVRASNDKRQPSVADFDRDGFVDTLSLERAGQLRLAYGDGRGHEAHRIELGSTDTFAIADFDRDGLLDVAVARSENDQRVVDILTNRGGRDFSRVRRLALGSREIAQLAAGDTNGDGSPDLAVLLRTDELFIFEGLGNGDFADKTTVTRGAAHGHRDLILADLNGDRRDDILIANEFDSQLWIGLGRGRQFDFTSYALARPPQDLAVGDVDQDGSLDVVVVEWDRHTNGIGQLFQGSQSGALQAATEFATGPDDDDRNHPSSVALGDVNGDGLLDIAVGHNNLKRCATSGGEGACSGNNSDYVTTIVAALDSGSIRQLCEWELPPVTPSVPNTPVVAPEDDELQFVPARSTTESLHVPLQLLRPDGLNLQTNSGVSARRSIPTLILPEGAGMLPSVPSCIRIQKDDALPASNGEVLDVSGDGRVSPIDALMIVNHLNVVSAASVAMDQALDVNGDGAVSPLDALFVVNHLNLASTASAEGEMDDAPPAASLPVPPTRRETTDSPASIYHRAVRAAFDDDVFQRQLTQYDPLSDLLSSLIV